MSESTFRERTLATRYQPRQSLPPNFADILKEYAREVLRAQPEDILDWSADYFKKLALAMDPMQAREPPVDHYMPVVPDPQREFLSQQMVRVFAKLDSENEGVLYTHLVQRVLMEGFHLSPSQALYILTSPYAVVNEQDTLPYEQLAKDSVRAVQYFQQTHREFEVDDIAHATVHGLNKNDVEHEFFRLFRLLDEAGTGRLSFADYRNALMNAPFHLTHRDIAILCIECDRSGNDDVEYEREVPRMFDRLVLAEQFELFDVEDSSEFGE